MAKISKLIEFLFNYKLFISYHTQKRNFVALFLQDLIIFTCRLHTVYNYKYQRAKEIFHVFASAVG